MKTMQNISLHRFPVDESPLLFRMDSISNVGKIAQDRLPHRHDFYAIYYATGGTGFQVIDFAAYPLLPDTLYFISPGQVHSPRFTRPMEGYMLGFLDDFLLNLGSPTGFIYELSFFHAVSRLPKLTLTPEESSGIKTLITVMDQEYRSENRDRISILRAYLHILLVKIQRLYAAAYPEERSHQESSFVRKFNHLVSVYYKTDREVRSYAVKMGVSAGHLSNRIKAMTGFSPGQIIRQYVVLEAKRLLAHTDLAVSEIVQYLNLEDSSYFSRMFSHITGLTPTAFRGLCRMKQE